MMRHKKLMVALLLLAGSLCAISNVQLAEQGKVIITFNDAEKCLSLQRGEVYTSIPGLLSEGSAMKLQQKRKKIALGYTNAHQVSLVDLEKEKIFARLNYPTQYGVSGIEALSWSADGNYLSVCPERSECPVWVFDVRSAEITEIPRSPKITYTPFTTHTVYTAALNPRLKHLLVGYSTHKAVGSNRGYVRVFDLEKSYNNSFSIVKHFNTSHQAENVHSIAFSNNGDYVAVSNDTYTSLRNALTYEEIKRLEHSEFSVSTRQAVFNDDDSILAISTKHKINIFKIPSFELIQTLKHDQEDVHQMDCNGEIVAAACKSGIMTWNSNNESSERTLH